MTDPLPRPEPVLDSARLAGAVAGFVGAVGAVLVFVGWATDGQVQQAAQLSAGVVVAIAALIATIAPVIAALKARKLVTPLESPRANPTPEHPNGQALIIADWYGKHAKREVPIPEPELPGWPVDGPPRSLDEHSASMGPDLP